VVYRLGDILGSVDHRVKIHKITPAQDKERGDLELKDHEWSCDRLPPRTLILDFTLTRTRFGRSHVHPIGQMTHTRRLDGPPESDGDLKEVVRVKVLHYHQLYINRSGQSGVSPSF